MSRAGERLYGDWRRAYNEDDRRAPTRRREQLRRLLLLFVALVFGGSALFRFG